MLLTVPGCRRERDPSEGKCLLKDNQVPREPPPRDPREGAAPPPASHCPRCCAGPRLHLVGDVGAPCQPLAKEALGEGVPGSQSATPQATRTVESARSHSRRGGQSRGGQTRPSALRRERLQAHPPKQPAGQLPDTGDQGPGWPAQGRLSPSPCVCAQCPEGRTVTSPRTGLGRAASLTLPSKLTHKLTAAAFRCDFGGFAHSRLPTLVRPPHCSEARLSP